MVTVNIAEEDIEVRDFTEEDVDHYLDFWYSDDSCHLSEMGVDPLKLPSRKIMKQMLSLKISSSDDNGKSSSKILCICIAKKSIGVHELTDFNTIKLSENVHKRAVMHAHIWSSEYRGMGIGIVSYVKALKVFFDRFNLDEILFETPEHNYAANAVKRQLGIKPYSRGAYSFPLANRPLDTIRYRVARDDLLDLEARMSLAFENKASRPP